MDIKNKLLAYGKKSITLEALTDLLKADLADTKGLRRITTHFQRIVSRVLSCQATIMEIMSRLSLTMLEKRQSQVGDF